nr:4Fe-4S binding protein [Desulfobacteraceae bacterium]
MLLDLLKTRIKQKYRTMSWPEGPLPALPERFAGRPVITGKCADGCHECVAACPTHAVSMTKNDASCFGPFIDTGKCLFCHTCESACPSNVIHFSDEHRLAALTRDDLVVSRDSLQIPIALLEKARSMFGRSLKLREVSAGGCNACEADSNVLTTIGWDLGRFGIQFVASPRHADGLFITGPVTKNMETA